MLPIAGDFFSYTRREPVGIVGQIIPVEEYIRMCFDLFELILVEFPIDFTLLESWSIGCNGLYNSG